MEKNIKYKKLPRSWYERPLLEVARDSIGKLFIYNSPQGQIITKIVEVEAYHMIGDPACHAHRGKTSRNYVMFGEGGHLYVYFIYGMYYCMNIVVEKEGVAAAVLIRALEPISGLELIRKNRPNKKDRELLNGPGKVCSGLGITKKHNGLDLTSEIIFLAESKNILNNQEIISTTRIGISQAKDLPWRFYEKNSIWVSKP